MGKRSTVTGYWRQRGDSADPATPAALDAVLRVTVNPAAANGTGTGVFLPKGARVKRVTVVSGHTGGTSPLLNIGVTGTNNGILAGGNANQSGSWAPGGGVVNGAAVAAAQAGSLMGTALTARLEVVAGTGGGTPGTGTSVAHIEFYMDDDQSAAD